MIDDRIRTALTEAIEECVLHNEERNHVTAKAKILEWRSALDGAGGMPHGQGWKVVAATDDSITWSSPGSWADGAVETRTFDCSVAGQSTTTIVRKDPSERTPGGGR